MRKISRILPLFLLLLSPVAAQEYLFESEPLVRTLIVGDAEEVGIRPSDSAVIANMKNKETVTLEPNVPLKLQVKEGNIVIVDQEGTPLFTAESLRFEPSSETATLLVAGVAFGVGWWWEDKEDRLYEGPIEFRLTKDGKLNVISILPIEEYLRGVVGSEIGSSSPEEALKVQAVAARGETLVALRTGKYAGDNYDICSDVNCQVYSGTRRRSDEVDAAIKATFGQALFHEGEPIGAYYASNCGGHSDNANLVWPDRHKDEVPYWTGLPDGDGDIEVDLTNEEAFAKWLASSPDVYCNPKFATLPDWTHASFRWTREFTAEEVTEAVAKHADIGRVTKIGTGKRGPSGRLTEATFVGETGTFTIGPELAIRRVFTPPLRGAGFIVETEAGAEEGKPAKFIIKGAGYGHGVGLCQTGAIGRATAGQKYDSILTHYYKQTEIKQAYPE